METVSVLDVISIGAQRDTIVVLPTLPHAIHWWPIIQQAFANNQKRIPPTNTRTAIVCRETKTSTRLWVPYAREPTMPMDIIHDRTGRKLLNLYGMYRGGLV